MLRYYIIFQVCVTDVRISISPAIIELLNGVYATMYAVHVQEQSVDVALEDYSDVWDCRPYSEQKDFWFLKAGMYSPILVLEIDDDLEICYD